jgi:hypothetical protein
MTPNYNLVRLIQQALYSLKRDYGNKITVNQGVPTVDIETGDVTRDVTSYTVHRAIVLPVKVLEAVKTLGQGGLAGRLNIVGSHYDTGKRLFIIDRRDLPVAISLDDWIRYDERKYTFDSVEEYEYHTAYLVIGTELIGEVSQGANITVSVSNDITLGSTGVAS